MKPLWHPKDPFYQALEDLVRHRGESAVKLWTLASGFNPFVLPATALENLRGMVNVVRVDLQDEARALIRDIESLFRSPPLP